MRQIFVGEGNRLKEELDAMVHRNKDLEAQMKVNEERSDQRLK